MRNEELYSGPEMDRLFEDFDPVEYQRIENQMMYELKQNTCIDCGKLIPFDEGFCEDCIKVANEF